MALKDLVKNKKNLAYIVLFAIVLIACVWSFIYAGMITKNFKEKIIDQTYKNKEANIENLLVTETKDGKKLWELYSESGRYSDDDSVVLLEDVIGNFYEEQAVKASFKADRGTYHTTKKEIILVYLGRDKDIVASGNVRIEKPKEAIIYGGKAVLKGDLSDFHIEGRTQTKFYM